MSHPVMHFEIAGKDRPALNAYYAKLFGWEIHDEAAMNYSMISRRAWRPKRAAATSTKVLRALMVLP